MAVSAAAGAGKIERLARFGLTTNDTDRLALFYERAFGFRRLESRRRSGGDFERLMDVQGGALNLGLALGDEVVELLQFDRPGRPYPTESSSADRIFQHFAIVVTDMPSAYQKLLSAPDWTAISSAGPERLPDRSGGVTAFKFRDPEGHPLELLAFPDGKAPQRWRSRPAHNGCIGIDHSAISVADSARSAAFYQGLGLQVAARSLNWGQEQARLDGLDDPRVEVTALQPLQPTPHVELLGYAPAAVDRGAALRSNDIAATRLIFETSSRSAPDQDSTARRLLDPDGHHLLVLDPIALA